MFDVYTDSGRVCQDCLANRYHSYPDGKFRCSYCGHVEGTPNERSWAPAGEEEPVETPTVTRTTRKRNA